MPTAPSRLPAARMKVLARIREFNRFYTNVLGILDRHFQKSAFSLSEGRVLYEILHYPGCTAIFLKSTLNMDEGYISRILNNFVKRGLIKKDRLKPDGRSFGLTVTRKGEKQFLQLNEASDIGINQVTRHLSDEELRYMAESMAGIKDAISRKGPRSVTMADIHIRSQILPGDIGYIAYLHGKLYQNEYGYDSPDLESYIAEGLLELYRQYDPGQDGVWICEHDGRIIASLFLMHRGRAAQLRYFLIEPAYRGLGLGKKLMEEYMAFLNSHDYDSSYLWTLQELHSAAHLYKRHGFVLTEEKNTMQLGKPAREQRYDLILTGR